MKVEYYKYFIDKYPIDYADKYYICWSATNDTFTKIEEGDELTVGLLIMNNDGITDEKTDICLSKHSNNKEAANKILNAPKGRYSPAMRGKQ